MQPMWHSREEVTADTVLTGSADISNTNTQIWDFNRNESTQQHFFDGKCQKFSHTCWVSMFNVDIL